MDLEMQQQMDRLRDLKNAAAAIVDYVRTVSPKSDFKPCARFYDWKLEPDTWIHLSFPVKYPGLTISLAVDLETLETFVKSLPDHTGLKVVRGRRYNWSRLYLKSARQLPVAFMCIEYAYDRSSNEYRKRQQTQKELYGNLKAAG
jgi:hypothetical protein